MPKTIQQLGRVLFFISLGCFTCLVMQNYAVPVVYASALTGLLGTFFFAKDAQAFVYIGSFIAMSTQELMSHNYFLLGAVTVATIVTYWTRNTALGIGGKFGTMAFVGCFVISALLGYLW